VKRAVASCTSTDYEAENAGWVIYVSVVGSEHSIAILKVVAGAYVAPPPATSFMKKGYSPAVVLAGASRHAVYFLGDTPASSVSVAT